MDGIKAFGEDQSLESGLLGPVHQGLLAGIEASLSLIALYDECDRVRYASPAFRAVFMQGDGGGSDFESIIRKNHKWGTGVLIPDGQVDEYVARARARRRSRLHHQFPVDLTDGRRLWLTETLLDNAWLLCEATDVTALRQVESPPVFSRDVGLDGSRIDSLTRLPNRRQCFVFLEQALSLAHARNRDLSVAIINLDYFKNVNDQFGRDVGDMVLGYFADVLRGSLRSSDIVGRIGDEEFMIIWPDATSRIVFDVLRRLRERPIHIQLPISSTKFSVTFSSGITQAKPEDTMHSLVARADKRSCIARARGCNAIEVDED